MMDFSTANSRADLRAAQAIQLEQVAKVQQGELNFIHKDGTRVGSAEYNHLLTQAQFAVDLHDQHLKGTTKAYCICEDSERRFRLHKILETDHSGPVPADQSTVLAAQLKESARSPQQYLIEKWLPGQVNVRVTSNRSHFRSTVDGHPVYHDEWADMAAMGPNARNEAVEGENVAYLVNPPDALVYQVVYMHEEHVGGN